jgi:hypothetical protein
MAKTRFALRQPGSESSALQADPIGLPNCPDEQRTGQSEKREINPIHLGQISRRVSHPKRGEQNRQNGTRRRGAGAPKEGSDNYRGKERDEGNAAMRAAANPMLKTRIRSLVRSVTVAKLTSD